MRLDLFLSCIVGGLIGRGIPQSIVRRIKLKRRIKCTPRHNKGHAAAEQEHNSEKPCKVIGARIWNRKGGCERKSHRKQRNEKLSLNKLS